MALFSPYRNYKQKINKWNEKFGKNVSRHIILLEINTKIDIIFYPEMIFY